MDQAGPNTRHFVRDDRCPNTTSTDGYTAIHLSASHCMGQRHNKIWIVIVQLRLSVAEIDHFMTGVAQHPDQIFL